MKSWNKVLLAAIIGLLLTGCDSAPNTKSTPDKASAEQMPEHAAENSMGEQPQETDGANDPAGKPVSP